MTAIKVGVAGCGRVAQALHLPILARLPGVELAAFAEPDADLRERTLHFAPRAATFGDYHALVELPQLDAIVICLPNGLHADAAIAAFERGKHVYLEKPLATNHSDGKHVLGGWRRSGRVGMIGFNYRFNPLYRALAQAIRSGRIGELVGARSVFSVASGVLPPWQQTRAGGGGVLLDLASHHFDLMRFFFEQRVEDVLASVRSLSYEGDTAIVQLRLANGLSVQSLFSRGGIEEDRFDVYGRSGKLIVDRHFSLEVEYSDTALDHARLKRLLRRVRSIARAPYILEKTRAQGYEPSHRAALEHFIRAVRTGEPASPDLRDGFNSLAVVLAAEESSRTGCRVPVKFDDADFAD